MGVAAREQFPTVPDHLLAWQHRSNYLLKELEHWDGDILALQVLAALGRVVRPLCCFTVSCVFAACPPPQELDVEVMLDDVTRFLSRKGYQSAIKARTSEKVRTWFVFLAALLRGPSCVVANPLPCFQQLSQGDAIAVFWKSSKCAHPPPFMCSMLLHRVQRSCSFLSGTSFASRRMWSIVT